jgi:hypothetical protein
MKKSSKFAITGVVAGVAAAVIGACCWLNSEKKKNSQNEDDYVDVDDCYDEEADTDETDVEA